MVEIAICLAIIGFALVAIIGVLPLGMNTQRDNREETIINQDASMLLEAIRNGSRGANDLTNNVYAITNYWTQYNDQGIVTQVGVDGYSYLSSHVTKIPFPPFLPITNGLRIIGLLSTPEFTSNSSGDFLPIPTLFRNNGYSNHIVAYVRSFSGLAAEKPPQDNAIMREDAFSYRVFCVNAPVPVDTNALFNSSYARQLSANLHELRLTFLWPQLPNGRLGNGRQTFRTMVAGRFVMTNDNNQVLYFYQSQSFTNAP